MKRADVLQTAEKMVCGHRETDHGSPENNFRIIANLWSAYKEVEITPTDVCMMMAMLKIARIKSGNATDDSFVDLAGYAACGAEVEELIKNESVNQSAVEYRRPFRFEMEELRVICKRIYSTNLDTTSRDRLMELKTFSKISIDQLIVFFGLTEDNDWNQYRDENFNYVWDVSNLRFQELATDYSGMRLVINPEDCEIYKKERI